MQSGKIKHWNSDKGYGFIDVDNQSEDVFFHGSKVRLSQPITVGQSVYFNSERNDKNQLRATKMLQRIEYFSHSRLKYSQSPSKHDSQYD